MEPFNNSTFNQTYMKMDVISSNILVVLVTAMTYILYKIAFSPLNRVRTLTEVGWSYLMKNDLRKRKLSDAIREAQKSRKLGNLPPVFPNGWFALLESRNLKKEEVQSVTALGENFAVFRTTCADVKIIEAYCPHLGANMAVGGVVKGSDLECPFHGWTFEGDTGICSNIPYTAKVPDCAKVKSWQCCEKNGFIYVWYHSDDIPPTYDVPDIEQIQSGAWTYRGRTVHEIAAHIQEIPENGADVQHLSHLHVPNVVKGADLESAFSNNIILDIIHHHWQAHWSPDKENKHIAKIELSHSFRFYNKCFEFMRVDVSIQQIGPSVVHLFFNTPVGKGVLIQNVTPMKPLCQKLTHQFYTSSSFITPLAKLSLIAEAKHVERDIEIWNSKQFMSKPLLVKEDKLIVSFRRWYSQFYTDTSLTLEDIKNRSLDW